MKKTLSFVLSFVMVLSLFQFGGIETTAKASTASTLQNASSSIATNYWVVNPVTTPSTITTDNNQIIMSNGLVERIINTDVNSANYGITTSVKNLYSDWTLTTSVGYEGELGINGTNYKIGGKGTNSLQYYSYQYNNTTEEYLNWQPNGNSLHKNIVPNVSPWPALGKSITLFYKFDATAHPEYSNVVVAIRYDIYQGIPVISKKATVSFGQSTTAATSIKITRLMIDELNIDPTYRQSLYIETTYNGGGNNASWSTAWSNNTLHVGFLPGPGSTTGYVGGGDTSNSSDFNGGPDKTLVQGDTFDSFKAFELLHTTNTYEWKQVEIQKMYDIIAPWTSESPTIYHIPSDDYATVRAAIDACSELGFDGILQSFGSPFNMENTDPAYIEQHKQLADYAHSKGLLYGGYTLAEVANNYGNVTGPEQQNYKTNLITGATTIQRCFDTDEGIEYMGEIKNFIEKTGMDILEMDGPYGMYTCTGGRTHNHLGVNDSVYNQWKIAVDDFFSWCKTRNIYINAPDWMFLNGTNKIGIGYDEYAWSLPRQQQNLYSRADDYTGTYWMKDSMGWSFMPIDEYHSGGAPAYYKPLLQNIDDYDYRLAGAFATGVIPCWRGVNPKDDTNSPKVDNVTKKWLDYYKKYKPIINSTTIHVKPPSMDTAVNARATSMDVVMHANSQTREKAMVSVFNQTDSTRTETFTIPMFYTGLTNLTALPVSSPTSGLAGVNIPAPTIVPTGYQNPSATSYPNAAMTDKSAVFMQEGASAKTYSIDSNGNIQLTVTLKPMSYTWFAVYSPEDPEVNGDTNLVAEKRPISADTFGNTEVITNGTINAENYSNSWDTAPHWVTYDLGSISLINSINLWHFFGDSRTYRDVVVQASNDINFSNGNVVTLFNNDTDNSLGFGRGTDSEYQESSSGKTINCTWNTQARYVRFICKGSTANTSNHYSQIKINGKKLFATPGNLLSGITATLPNGPDNSNMANNGYKDDYIDVGTGRKVYKLCFK